MSTSYYAYIKMKPTQKEALMKAIADDKLLEFEHLIDENIESSIPVGHRAGGWKFSWSPYNKNLKSLDVKGIKEFVYRGDVVIYNEYREILDKDEFLKMTFDWGKDDGWDSMSYHKEHLNEHQLPVTDYQRTAYKFVNEHFPDKTIKFESSYQCEFYSDGLRWSIFE